MKSLTDSLPSLPLLRYSMALGLAAFGSSKKLADVWEEASSYFMLPPYFFTGTSAYS
jgi:hypothetical protein